MTMKRRIVWMLTAVLAGVILLAACAAQSPQVEAPGERAAATSPSPAPPVDQSLDQKEGATDVYSYVGGTSSFSQRVIKSASLDIRVEKGKLKEATVKLTFLAESKGGFMQSSQLSSSDSWQEATLMLVVPVQDFANTLSEVEKMGEVVSSQTSGQDITQEYYDLELDLTHWEAEHQSALLLLDKATTLDEIIKVRQFLEPIDQQINQIKGRMQFLKQSSDFSKIQVTLREPEDPFWPRVGDVFLISLSFLATILVAVLPWGVLALLILFLVLRIFRRSSPRPPVPPSSPPTQSG
jgi:hypothetical protein